MDRICFVLVRMAQLAFGKGCSTHLVNCRYARTETTMDAKHPPINNSTQCKIVKHFATIPPDIRAAVLARALVVKAIDLGNLPRLVVAPDQGDPIGIANLVCEEEQERLDAVEASIDKVACFRTEQWVSHDVVSNRHVHRRDGRGKREIHTHEEIVGRWTGASMPK